MQKLGVLRQDVHSWARADQEGMILAQQTFFKGAKKNGSCFGLLGKKLMSNLFFIQLMDS